MECPKCGLVQGDAPRCVGCGARSGVGSPGGGRRPAPFAAAPDGLPANGFTSVGILDRQKSLLFQQIARLVRAGVAPIAAFEGTAASVSGRRLRALNLAIAGDLGRGKTLADAMRRFPRDFDAHEVGSVHAAEQTGALPETLDRLREHLDRRRQRRNKMLGGLVYPLVVLCLSFFLLPLAHLFFGDVGTYLREALVPFGVALGLLFGGIWLRGRLRRHPRISPAAKAFAARVPIANAVLRRTGRRTFCEHLGRAIGAGLPIERALESAGAATGDPRFERLARDARAAIVDQGGTLTDALRASGLFPDDALLLVAGGERAGDLAGSFETIAQHEEEDLDQANNVLNRLATIGLTVLILGYVGLKVFSGMTDVLTMGQEEIRKNLGPNILREFPTNSRGLLETFDDLDEALRGPAIKPIPK